MNKVSFGPRGGRWEMCGFGSTTQADDGATSDVKQRRSHGERLVGRERGPEEDGRPDSGLELYVALLDRDILETENPYGSPCKTAAALRSVNQGEFGLGVCNGQGNAGEANPRTYVERPIRDIAPDAGKDQRVGDVAIDDPRSLHRTNAARLDRFGAQPLRKGAERLVFRGIEFNAGPARCPIKPFLGMFPVKHAA